jgi:hypothetical protein
MEGAIEVAEAGSDQTDQYEKKLLDQGRAHDQSLSRMKLVIALLAVVILFLLSRGSATQACIVGEDDGRWTQTGRDGDIDLDMLDTPPRPTLQPTRRVYLNSSEGAVLLQGRGCLNQHYFGGLASHFSTQINQAMCGIATATTMLNALELPPEQIPEDKLYMPYKYFTVDSFFQNITYMKAADVMLPPGGVGIQDMPVLLRTYAYVDWLLAQDLLRGPEDLRHILQTHLIRRGRFLAVNYHRAAGIGQVGGGHWAPIAAYHPGEDMVLLMDPARYKYPPVWVPLSALFESIMFPNPCGLYTRRTDGEKLGWDTTHFRKLFGVRNASDPEAMALWQEYAAFFACREATRGVVLMCRSLPCSLA